MRKHGTTAVSLLLTGALVIAPLQATEIHSGAGTTSAAFLKIGAGSRAAAMAGAFTALSDDVTALYWNPAGLARMESGELHITHDESFENIRHDFIGYAQPVKSGVFGGALYGLYTPNDLERRSGLAENDPYEPLTAVEGYFQASDLAAQVSYARRVRRQLDAGVSVKAIRQTIDDVSAYAAAVDLGLLYSLPSRPLTAGLVLQNAGTPVKFREKSYPLPFNARAGAAYRWTPRFSTAFDISKPVDNFFSFALGAEYTPAPLLSLRCGYSCRENGQEITDATGLTAGLGLRFSLKGMPLKFDYGFVPQGVLGNSHRVSLSICFNNKRHPKTVAAVTSKADARRSRQPTAPEPAAATSVTLQAQTYRPVKLSYTLRTKTGRTALYAVSGTMENSVLLSLQGDTLLPAGAHPSVDVLVEKGEQPLPCTLSFRSAAPLARASCLLRLPQAKAPLTATLEDGTVLPLSHVTTDPGGTDFRITMDRLQRFTVNEAPR